MPWKKTWEKPNFWVNIYSYFEEMGSNFWKNVEKLIKSKFWPYLCNGVKRSKSIEWCYKIVGNVKIGDYIGIAWILKTPWAGEKGYRLDEEKSMKIFDAKRDDAWPKFWMRHAVGSKTFKSTTTFISKHFRNSYLIQAKATLFPHGIAEWRCIVKNVNKRKILLKNETFHSLRQFNTHTHTPKYMYIKVTRVGWFYFSLGQ